jgi:hypothetical protein
MAFSASEAAFEGFRVVRREPFSVLLWAVARLAVSLLSLIVIAPLAAPMMAAVEEAGSAPSPEQALALIRQAAVVYAVAVPLALVILAVFGCAVFRVVLRPEDKGLGRLKLGGDELRMIGLMLLMGLLYLGASIGLGLAIGLCALLVAAIGGTNQAGGAFGVLLGVALVLGFCGLVIWAAVRLSLAMPMSFVQRRVVLFSSWRLTRGRFWSLFGCYLLALVFVIILNMAALMVFAAVGLATGSSLTDIASSLFRPSFSTETFLNPGRLIDLVFSSLLGAVMGAVSLAPAAAAYRDIAGPGPEGHAAAFE